MNTIELLRAYEAQMIADRRWMHEHPELSGQETQTIEYVIAALKALGLAVHDVPDGGVFGVLGVEAAMNAGHGNNLFLCVFMGMTTGVGGGILRDVFSRTIPAVLHKRIYAVAVIAGSLVYYGLRQTALPVLVSMIGGTAVTIIIRICSSHFRWDLPVVRLEK